MTSASNSRPSTTACESGRPIFTTNITDLIDSNATFTSYANVGRALTYGAESFVAFTVNEQLKLRTD